nr:capsule assembly Wzi family protein [Govania unica]
MAALQRVRGYLPVEEDFNRTRLGGNIAVTNKESFLRDFGAGARDQFDLSVSAQHQWSSTFVKLQAGRQFDTHGGSWKLDGSYAAQLVGNWIFYAGAIDQWWGPGWASSLILSNNARPMPRMGFMRNNPKPIDLPVLRWLGPWQLSSSIAVMNGPRTDYKNPLLANIRLSFNPTRRLEIGMFHDFQFCGEGRLCNFKQFLTNFGVAGLSENINSGDPLTDPGNVMSGLDFRYGWRMKTITSSIYGQLYAEDSSSTTLFKSTSYLAGFSVAAPLQKPGWSMRLVGEYANTVALSELLTGHNQYNMMYDHYIFLYGYRYRGKSVGASQDNDSHLTSLMLSLNAPNNVRYGLKYHHAALNLDDAVLVLNSGSMNRKIVNIVEASVDVPTDMGAFKVTLRAQDNQPNSLRDAHLSAAIEGRWDFLF